LSDSSEKLLIDAVPAEAGQEMKLFNAIRKSVPLYWIPASAGMTDNYQ